MDLFLSGQTAVVTGARRGIGPAVTRGLVAEGVRVPARAAPARPSGFSEITGEDWQASLTLNLMAAVRTTRAALPAMLAACPVRTPCPERALATGQDVGVWGRTRVVAQALLSAAAEWDRLSTHEWPLFGTRHQRHDCARAVADRRPACLHPRTPDPHAGPADPAPVVHHAVRRGSPG